MVHMCKKTILNKYGFRKNSCLPRVGSRMMANYYFYTIYLNSIVIFYGIYFDFHTR